MHTPGTGKGTRRFAFLVLKKYVGARGLFQTKKVGTQLWEIV
jgi:hypothetical protein